MNTTKIATIAVVVIMSAPVLRAAAHVVPGEQRRWALISRTRLEQPGGGRPIEIDLRGDWLSTISAVRPGEYDAELELANAGISGVGVGNAPQGAKEQLERSLQRPFWGTYRDDGALLSVHFFKDVDPSDRNLLQMIATEMQFVDVGPERPAWTMLERDSAGEYLAIYNRQGPNRIVKRKLKYVHTDGAAGSPAGGVHVDIDQSEGRFSLDAEGGILSLDASNRMRIGVDMQGAGQLTATTETHLANFRGSSAPELIGSLARALPNVENSPVVTHASDPRQLRDRLDQQLLAGLSTDSLLRAAMTRSDDQMLSARLSALFRQRPEAAVSALALLRKIGPQKRITDALGSAGSPAAVEVIGTVARDRTLSTALRIDALTAFMFIEHPSPEAMRAPAALLDDEVASIASAARLVCGALASAGRPEHPAESEAIDAALVNRYRKARQAGEVSGLLTAMGNSIGPSVLPVIEDALRDPRAPVREAAARALRLAAGPEVDRLLAATITDDSDPSVRATALFAVSFRHPVAPLLGEALVRAAGTDPVENVRSAAVTLLRQNPGASPRVAETLEWVAAHDSKPGMRRLAQDALTAK